MLKVERANHQNLNVLSLLFDSYRVFYGQPSNRNAAKSFLTNRLTNKESVIFLAFENDVPVGFVQLYKTFSSVSLEQFYILNDLFVDAKYRGKGIGGSLLNRAKEHCTSTEFKGLALETAKDNPAQNLYEKLGWKKDTDFLHYFWTCPKNE